MISNPIVIRQCSGLDELELCVQLQLDVWGYSDSDVIPRRVFLVAQKIGGQVFGAFDSSQRPAADGETSPGRLAGFLMALPGYRNGHSYLHSHMLAVRPEYRNQGLGRRLKLAQRIEALSRGIEMIEWTFDPLEIKNAYLNIEKLGAIARRYTPDFYGSSTSPLQGGLPTDRLHAEWWLRSKRVERVLNGQAAAATGEYVTVTVSNEIYEWKQSTAERYRALEIQTRNRLALLESFARGLSILRFERDRDGNGIYKLGVWDENFHY